MALAHQIREQVASFLIGEQQLKSLTEWLARNVWLADTHEPDARQLTAEVDLIVAEYSNHHIGKDELRRQLAALLFNAKFPSPSPWPVVATGTTTNVVLVMPDDSTADRPYARRLEME